jgi:hypothetical protein
MDIFDIIEEAPSSGDLRPAASAPVEEEEAVFEVEPEFEVEEQQAVEAEEALPVGKKAVEEMRAGLGLSAAAEQAEPGGVESLGLAAVAALDTFEKPVRRRAETPKPELPERARYVPQIEPSLATMAPRLSRGDAQKVVEERR